jgi:hypothetical protein
LRRQSRRSNGGYFNALLTRPPLDGAMALTHDRFASGTD